MIPLGKFIVVDNSYKSCNARSVAGILVEIDVSLGLFDTMEIVVGESRRT